MTNNELKEFWKDFREYFKISKKDISEFLKNLKNSLEKENSEKEILKLKEVLLYIINNHPYMSSKYEDIIKIDQKSNNLLKIKSEALIGNDILNDKLISNNLIKNRQELINIITKDKQLKEIGIELTLKHIETAIHLDFINNKTKLSINISEEEITSDYFFNKVQILSKNYKKIRNNHISEILQFEILEYEIDFTKPYVWNKLKRLKTLNIDLSIDDFGSEFSNLERVKTIRKNQEIIQEYIQTIKIDKKITSSIAYKQYKSHLINKQYNNFKNDFHNFILHISNILDVPSYSIEHFLLKNEEKDIKEIIKKIEKEYYINIEEITKKEIENFNKLLEYLKNENLLKKINIVFEFIDHDIVKQEIEKIAATKEIEILAQGYYFEETQKPIFYKDIKKDIKILFEVKK